MQKWRALDAFRHFGVDVRDRYAWSAQNGTVTVLTLWQDELHDDGTTVIANGYRKNADENWIRDRRNKTRISHLINAWNGDKTFRVIMLKARDENASPRSASARWPDDDLVMTLTDLDPATGEFKAVGHRTQAGDPWTFIELRACVQAYRKLWVAQQAGEKMNKAGLARSVLDSQLKSRTKTAYENRMQNISAVMTELGIDWVKGYPPLKNIGAPKVAIISLINDAWQRTDQLEQPTDDPELLETRTAAARLKLTDGPGEPPPGRQAVGRKSRSANVFDRDPNIIAWVETFADGKCEACGETAPFLRADGRPYLEVHHVRPLAEGGPDQVDNAIAACPNCHRRLHSGDDRTAFRKSIILSHDRLTDYPKIAPPLAVIT